MSSVSAPQLVVDLLRTGSVLLAHGRPLFARHELTDAQFNLLHAVAPHPAGISQREISEALVVDGSNVTGLIDRLEARGLVRRAADPEDRRRHRVQLTAAGKRVHEAASLDYDRAIAWLAAGLTKAECAAVLTALDKLRKRAELGAAEGRF